MLTLTDAVTRYLSALTVAGSPAAHVELHRFGRAIGWERSVEDLAPPEVAAYAEAVIAAGGNVQGRLTPLKEFLVYLKKKELSAHNLAPHVKIPRAAVRGAASSRPGFQTITMTDEGIGMLRAEMAELKGQRGAIAESIKLAAADKDFRENAPLDAAREHQGKTETRIRELEETLRHAVVADQAEVNPGRSARVGSRVVLRDLTNGADHRYTLVDSAEADPLGGKLSVASPVGQKVVGRTEGDEVVVPAPRGERRFRITQVER